ncbi:hypothetical protein HDV01_006540 [Terramyces sp. JEL0728]|nr:hypothetical protein HDV01_006540 [Terramyces sp. JEL0728]
MLIQKQIEEIAKDLGAKYSGAFTTKVTHLIAQNAGSEKYLVFYWLIDNRDCNIKELLKSTVRYEIRELSGCVISTTGFQSAELNEMIPTIKQKGGMYSPNLSTSTTHLIVKSQDHQSEKLKAAKKWNLVIKEIDWIMEKAELYLENHYFYFGEGFETSLSKYLKTIIREGGGNFMTSYDSIVTHFIMSGSDPTAHDREIIKVPVVVNYKWLSECFITKQLIDYQKWIPETTNKKEKEIIQRKPKVFAGMKFNIVGFQEIEKLLIHKGIVDQGGAISEDGINICPFAIKTQVESKSEFWIERCIQEERVVDDDSVLYSPTKHDLPIQGFGNFKFGISGFQEIERLWINRVVTLMGAELTETFSRENTHLIWTENPSQKSKMAQKWRIPLIETKWIYDILENGYKSERERRNGGALKLMHSSQPVIRKRRIKLPTLDDSRIETSSQSSLKVSDLPPITLHEFETAEPEETIDMNAINATLENLQNIEPKSKTVKRRYNETWDSSPLHATSGKISYLANSQSPATKEKLFVDNVPKKIKAAKCFFLFSGLSNSIKSALTQKIPLFDAEILESAMWDNKCTHLIVETPMHTEKFLSACASGAWILTPQFILDCASKQAILNEEDYQLDGRLN